MHELALLHSLVKAITSLALDPPSGSDHPGRCRGDAGYTTEAVIVIAGLAALAIAVVAIIVLKVRTAANNIPTS